MNGKMLGTCWGKLFIKKYVNDIEFDSNTNYMEDTLFLLQYIEKSNVKKIGFCDTNYYYNCLNEKSITKNKKCNTLIRLKTIFYSLNQINILTNYRYIKSINQRKIK